MAAKPPKKQAIRPERPRPIGRGIPGSPRPVRRLRTGGTGTPFQPRGF